MGCLILNLFNLCLCRSTAYQPQIMKRIMTVMSSTTYSRHEMADKVSGYGVELLIVAGIGILFAIFSTLSAARIAQEIGADVREATYKKINTFSYENVENSMPETLLSV